MEDNSWGYSELPPDHEQVARKDRNRLSNPEAAFPPAERPVYAPSPVPQPEDEPEGRGGSALSITSLVMGITAVILAAVFFYRSTVNIRTAENQARQALSAVDELKRSGGPTPAALKIELMRTTRTLDAMAVEFAAEEEAMQKIAALRAEVEEILATLEEKGQEEPVAAEPPPATPAAAETPADGAPAAPPAGR